MVGLLPMKAAEIKYKDVSHCRLGALEQENVMLRVGRKASADHCQSLEIQVCPLPSSEDLQVSV